MDLPVNFKFDVRIRARMLAKGTISDADVTKHLEGLQDREPQTEVIELAQPALTPPGERAPVSVRPAPRPAPVAVPIPAAERSAPMSVLPPLLAVDKGWDEDDGDDDEPSKAEAKPQAVAAKPPVAEATPAPVASKAEEPVASKAEEPVASKAEEDEDDEDEDEDEDDEDEDEDEDDETPEDGEGE
jgi:hypothetical protein